MRALFCRTSSSSSRRCCCSESVILIYPIYSGSAEDSSGIFGSSIRGWSTVHIPYALVGVKKINQPSVVVPWLSFKLWLDRGIHFFAKILDYYPYYVYLFKIIEESGPVGGAISALHLRDGQPAEEKESEFALVIWEAIYTRRMKCLLLLPKSNTQRLIHSFGDWHAQSNHLTISILTRCHQSLIPSNALPA